MDLRTVLDYPHLDFPVAFIHLDLDLHSVLKLLHGGFVAKKTKSSREKGHKGLCNKSRTVNLFWESSAPQKKKHKINAEINNL